MRSILLAGCALTLSACITPAPSDRPGTPTARDVAGVVGPPGAGVEEGVGRAGFRVYAAPPTDVFSSTPPAATRGLRVWDGVVHTRLVSGMPLYRVGLASRDPGLGAVPAWPRTVRLETADGVRFARLPENPVADEDGLVWSAWTWCPSCLDLDDLDAEASAEDMAALDRAVAAARRAEGVPRGFVRRFVTGVALPQDLREALAAETMATLAAARVARVREEGPSDRAAYVALARVITEGAPATRAEAECGTFEPPRAVGDVPGRALNSYIACVEDVRATHDMQTRASRLEALGRREAQLARAAGIAPQERFAVPTVEEERAELRDLIRQARDRAAGARMQASDSAALAEGSAARTDTDLDTDLDAGRDAGANGAGSAATAAGADAGTAGSGTGTDGSGEVPGVQDAESAAAPQPDAPEQEIYYVARLFENGAEMTRGPGGDSCVAGLECETGAIVPLITVQQWCATPRTLTQTRAGAAVVVQRYLPGTRDAEVEILAGDSASRLHMTADSDDAALKAALEALGGITRDGDPRYFVSYQGFYAVNAESRECLDSWRDSALAKVGDNPVDLWFTAGEMD